MKTLVYIILYFIFLMFLSCNSNSVIENKNKINTDSSVKTLLPNRLEIYAFHGTRQCETCKNMKTNTKATLDKYFVNELNNGKIIFQIIDVDDVKNEKLAEKFQATGTALMLNKIVNGKDSIIDWSDFAFDKANDANTYISELKTKIETVLK
jgi:thioredoxin-related protein